MVERRRDFSFKKSLLLFGHTATLSPAFPGECLRKPILCITLYYFLYKVNEYFTIRLMYVVNVHLLYTNPPNSLRNCTFLYLNSVYVGRKSVLITELALSYMESDYSPSQGEHGLTGGNVR